MFRNALTIAKRVKYSAPEPVQLVAMKTSRFGARRRLHSDPSASRKLQLSLVEVEVVRYNLIMVVVVAVPLVRWGFGLDAAGGDAAATFESVSCIVVCCAGGGPLNKQKLIF